MGGACVFIDVAAVRLRVDHIGPGAQGIKNALGNIPGGAVGAVQAHLQTLEGIKPQADQVAHIAVPARHIVNRPADAGTGRQGHRRKLPVQIILHHTDDLRIHLLAGTGEELDAVVIVRIMGGGDHHTAVKAIGPGHIGNGGRGGDMEQAGFRAGGGDAAGEGILKHIAGAPGVLADDDPGRTLQSLLPSEISIIPAQKAAHLKGMIHRQGHIGFPPEAIGSKIFTHYRASFFTRIPPVFQICPPGTTPRTQDVG